MGRAHGVAAWASPRRSLRSLPPLGCAVAARTPQRGACRCVLARGRAAPPCGSAFWRAPGSAHTNKQCGASRGAHGAPRGRSTLARGCSPRPRVTPRASRSHPPVGGETPPTPPPPWPVGTARCNARAGLVERPSRPLHPSRRPPGRGAPVTLRRAAPLRAPRGVLAPAAASASRPPRDHPSSAVPPRHRGGRETGLPYRDPSHTNRPRPPTPWRRCACPPLRCAPPAAGGLRATPPPPRATLATRPASGRWG